MQDAVGSPFMTIQSKWPARDQGQSLGDLLLVLTPLWQGITALASQAQALYDHMQVMNTKMCCIAIQPVISLYNEHHFSPDGDGDRNTLTVGQAQCKILSQDQESLCLT